MKDYVVWLDSEDAHVFALETTGIEKSHVKKSFVDHHTTSKKDQPKDVQEEPFFRDVTEKLHDANQILLMGPGVAKNHFKTHLETHQTKTLGTKIIGLETVEKMTDNQVMATARNFFKDHELFNKPV